MIEKLKNEREAAWLRHMWTDARLFPTAPLVVHVFSPMFWNSRVIGRFYFKNNGHSGCLIHCIMFSLEYPNSCPTVLSPACRLGHCSQNQVVLHAAASRFPPLSHLSCLTTLFYLRPGPKSSYKSGCGCDIWNVRHPLYSNICSATVGWMVYWKGKFASFLIRFSCRLLEMSAEFRKWEILEVDRDDFGPLWACWCFLFWQKPI